MQILVTEYLYVFFNKNKWKFLIIVLMSLLELKLMQVPIIFTEEQGTSLICIVACIIKVLFGMLN